MIEAIHIQNYRSIVDLELEFGRLNVVSGPNGCGKSNVYHAIQLLSAAANGQSAQALGEDGGLENVMWSGDSKRDTPKRVILSCRAQEFEYQLQVGFPPIMPYPTQFALDAEFKEENIWLPGFHRRPSARVLQRKNQAVFLLDVEGNRQTYTDTVYDNESVFGQLSDPHLYPEVSKVREIMRGWRFYHDFSVSRHSPLRQAQHGYRSPVLASDGTNLAAAFQTIVEIGNVELMTEILASAFPECHFFCENERSRFQVKMQRQGLRRPLLASEMSDGTLRFLCLTVALLSPRPPSFIALNEPENSLHPDMLPALANLVVEASRETQIWLTSHSRRLAELIGERGEFQLHELENRQGRTVLVNG
ncbi:hypothetical protein TUM12370_20820 [Salmonella enterica subsp. enterica serovar Choleraesuis]|nr:hypothetical protein TUM12370_20820 [Salmonella enterica subsp. enterica serovar Choleraesuis]